MLCWRWVGITRKIPSDVIVTWREVCFFYPPRSRGCAQQVEFITKTSVPASRIGNLAFNHSPREKNLNMAWDFIWVVLRQSTGLGGGGRGQTSSRSVGSRQTMVGWEGGGKKTRVPWCASECFNILQMGEESWFVSGFPWSKYFQQGQFQVTSGKSLDSQNSWKFNNQLSLAGMNWLWQSNVCMGQEVDLKSLGWEAKWGDWIIFPMIYNALCFFSLLLLFLKIMLRMFV